MNLPDGPLSAQGTNGQQLQFNCKLMTYGSVKGYNQNGNYVQWSGQAYPGTQAMYYITSGWYWVGNVQAFWYYNGQWHSKTVNVPKQQSGDITSAWC